MSWVTVKCAIFLECGGGNVHFFFRVRGRECVIFILVEGEKCVIFIGVEGECVIFCLRLWRGMYNFLWVEMCNFCDEVSGEVKMCNFFKECGKYAIFLRAMKMCNFFESVRVENL